MAASGDRLAAASGPTYNFLLPDLHGSVAGSLSADQSTVTSATRYDAWGDTIATGAAGGTPVGNTAWKYQGRLDISPSGLGTPLYAMGARLYDPGVGAFTSLDTVAGSAQAPLSMNRFLYAAADPATLVDPTGHRYCTVGNPDDCDGYAPGTTTRQRQKVDLSYARHMENQEAIAARRRAQWLAAAKANRALAAAQRKDRQADADFQSVGNTPPVGIDFGVPIQEQTLLTLSSVDYGNLTVKTDLVGKATVKFRGTQAGAAIAYGPDFLAVSNGDFQIQYAKDDLQADAGPISILKDGNALTLGPAFQTGYGGTTDRVIFPVGGSPVWVHTVNLGDAGGPPVEIETDITTRKTLENHPERSLRHRHRRRRRDCGDACA